MSQLRTLFWLKWTLFKNSLRSSKATLNRLASLLGMLLALLFALALAIGFGFVAYALTDPSHPLGSFEGERGSPALPNISAEFIFFTILGFSFMLWATIPISTGSSRQFEPGNLLMYPISLRKLFALDFISELTTLQSIFAIPAILAIGIGAGLGTGMIGRAVFAALAAAAFGLALTKWLALSVGALTRKKRTRGETVIAIIGAVVGLGGALVGQIAPAIFKHADYVKSLRWTPPGAAAFALSTGLTGSIWGYLLALLALLAYTFGLVFVAYWVARRAALGMGGKKRRLVPASNETSANYTGWELPFAPASLSAIVEKELRYVMRNAQLRMMAFMPLILIVVRFFNTRRFGQDLGGRPAGTFASDFFYYGQGLIAAGGVLYVFLVLTGLSCNLFAFEEGGMRTLILSPVERKKILGGKNIANAVLALCFASLLLIVNQLIFRDITLGALLFVVVSFVIFASLTSMVGNWLSIRFPKRMKFGKRLNVSGVVGLLIIPILIFLALPPLAATAAGFITGSLTIEYVTLSIFAVLSFGFYLLVIGSQGELLQRREVEILEAVREPADE